MPDSCLFCRLVKNEIPSYTVYEDGETRAFFDIGPSAPGHTMVILKKHGVTILDHSTDELGKLMNSVQKVVRGLAKTLKTEVFTIGINHGEELGVHHLHVHVIPRFQDDRGGVIQSIVRNEPKEGLTELLEKVRKNME
jgi:histidine triad (HIT) family protein